MLTTQMAADMLSISPTVLLRLPILRVRMPGVRRVFWRMSDLVEYVQSLYEVK